MSDIDPERDFDDEDEYISTADIIMKVNINENRIHVWSMDPMHEEISFRETLSLIMGNNEKLLEQLILQQYSLDNQTIHGDNYDIYDTLGIYQNQYLNRVYLTSNEGVYLQH